MAFDSFLTVSGMSPIISTIAGIGVTFAVIVILWTLVRKKQEDKEYGGFVRQSTEESGELAALEKMLSEQGIDVAELRQASAEMQAGEAETAQLAQETEQGEQAIQRGDLPAAEAETDKAEKRAKALAKQSGKILKALEKLRAGMQKQMDLLKKEKSEANKLWKTAQEEGERAKINKARADLAKIMRRQMEIGASLNYINRIISAQKSGNASFNIIAKNQKEIEGELKKGISAGIILPKQQQIIQKLQQKEASERQIGHGLNALFAPMENEVRETQRQLAEEQAEKARLAREKQIEEQLIGADRSVKKELVLLERDFAVVFKTEAKNKNIQAALKTSIVVAAKNLFIAAATAVKEFKAQKNIILRAESLLKVNINLGRIASFSQQERQELARAFSSAPSNTNKAMLRRFDAAIALARQIKIKLQNMETTLAALINAP
ncbi:MAG: hypothetical protein AABX75_00990 [Nanoarchaeota archaeon]